MAQGLLDLADAPLDLRQLVLGFAVLAAIGHVAVGLGALDALHDRVLLGHQRRQLLFQLPLALGGQQRLLQLGHSDVPLLLSADDPAAHATADRARSRCGGAGPEWTKAEGRQPSAHPFLLGV